MSNDKLPDGWTRVKFGDVVRKVNDRVDPDSAGIERYVAGEHMDTDDLTIRRWGEVGDGYLGPAFHMRFKPGHVLYGSRRTYLRKVAVADFEGITANTTFVIEPSSNNLLPEFLPLVMTTEAFHEHSIKQSKGSVNPYINFSDLTWYEFALPPFDEQSRIADLLSAFDAQLTALAAASEAAERAALSVGRSVLASANGSTVPLGDVADVVGGVTKDGGRVSTELSVVVPYLRVANVLRGRIDVSNLAEITVPPEVVSKLRLLPGDVLINEGGDRDKLGRGWIWDGSTDPCIHQNHVFRARVHDPRFSALLVAWMANFGNPVWFERNGRQSTNLASISLSAVKRFPLPVLHDGERERFDAVISRQLRLSESITKQIDSATDARKSVLEQLLGGPHVQ